jgi:hypothetical protein
MTNDYFKDDAPPPIPQTNVKHEDRFTELEAALAKAEAQRDALAGELKRMYYDNDLETDEMAAQRVQSIIDNAKPKENK